LTASDTSLIAYKGGDTIVKMTDVEFNLNNVKMSYVLKYMEDVTPYHYSPFPIIDETGFKGKIGNISITTKINRHESLNGALKKYKMSFTIKERELEVLVVTDTNTFHEVP
jgi:hypothetical protein